MLAVSKTKPASAIEEAIAAGQRAFGENYVQEGVEGGDFQPIDGVAPVKMFGHQPAFVGLQGTNKVPLCHTVDRLKIATRLNEQRPAHLPPLKVLIQINISVHILTQARGSPSGRAAPDEVTQRSPRLRHRALPAHQR
jgi:uncharacterized pyridoxal phosphate-containing UPF0001 family protein